MTTAGLDARIEAILNGPAGPRVGAFFDFDGTVVDGFSVTSFLMPMVRARIQRMDFDPAAVLRRALREGPQAMRLVASTGMHGEPDDAAVRSVYEVALGALAGRQEDEVVQLGEHVFATSLCGRLRSEAWALIEAHRMMEHTLVLVSSATRYQTGPMARELGIEHALCTELEISEGVLTGDLQGPLLRGEAKADAVTAFASAHEVDLTVSHAYADAFDDVPLLESIGKPCAVHPTPRLAQMALWRQWPVIGSTPQRSQGLRTLARSAAAYGGMVTGGSAGVGIGLLNTDRRQVGEQAMNMGADAFLSIAGIKLRVEGRENLWSSRPAVFMTNHQSALDLAIMIRLVQEHYSGMAKASLGKVPGLGHLLRCIDTTFVDRGAVDDADALCRSAVEQLNRGISIWITPEGTRSRTPMPGPFKKGAFHIARKAGVPVVPIVIRNAGQLMSKAAKTARSGEIDIAVLPPIEVCRWSDDELDARIGEVRGLFVDRLRNWDRSAMVPGELR
ncbi:HAD-IB family hydrolase [Actinomadura barringtoniae]|uniref:1-acyl-sn-glycerol-3-phosphate acyltransferase n=1 Tax=Actinomadura barringtoniae TaxID=1427535 RepID=A0A939PIZ8_9ACTN|nr:HAD-IB family hydrolase [Actinomadura barringtoniae]MBO2450948.1 HAD-IB family hydrolase [Actinomadura barringtoniae]